MTSEAFPFDAVVGQDDAKLALRLAALDPLIGGVLLRGQKGAAKTTLARGLAALLGGAPFVDLPVGATEDRVVGTLDTRAALTDGEVRFEPGLLAAAHGGVLYVDEINLLPDHLVDVLLDVAVSGENVVERDGLSHRHPARFVLVGSMNPEEGELRPQLLDRFGLCVEVTAPTAIDDRVEAVRRRLAFDSAERGVHDVTTSPSPVATGAGRVPDALIDAACRLALEVGAEGLRADLTLCRAAAALARSDGRTEASAEDLRRVAPLVLAHRSRRNPFDPPVVPPEQIEQAMREVLGGLDDGRRSDAAREERSGDSAGDDDGGCEGDGGGPGTQRPVVIGSARRPPSVPRGRSSPSPRGRTIGDAPAGPGDSIAVVPSIRAAAAGDRSGGGIVVDARHLRRAVRVAERPRTTVLCVDLSGSMGAPERAEAATGTVLGLLADAYERRHQVGLVTFRGRGATTVLAPTGSVEVAGNRLRDLVTGGPTPLAAGLAEALHVAERAAGDDGDALIAVLTDGRATGAGGLDAALEVAARIRRSTVEALVLDCEGGASRLGLAARLAEAMGARHVRVTDLAPAALASTIRGGVR
ncbi:MAG TPA: ATP-binding protein [Microthrixaceae bacterium]|nr:ATP-binding protein [Microthrixaceae bacterium]